MPINIPLPTNAKITALVRTGRSRPKVMNWRLRLAVGQNNWVAASRPAAMPTRPQTTVAMANARTMRLSSLNVSSSLPEPPPAGLCPFELSRRNPSLISASCDPCDSSAPSRLPRHAVDLFSLREALLAGFILTQDAHGGCARILKLPRPHRPDEPRQKGQRDGQTRQYQYEDDGHVRVQFEFGISGIVSVSARRVSRPGWSRRTRTAPPIWNSRASGSRKSPATVCQPPRC